MTTCVLVIDVQQGLCEGEGAVFDGAGTISRINLVTRKARKAGATVIFVQHESPCGHLEHGSSGWQLAAGLEVLPGDVKVAKTTPDAFLGTELADLLTAMSASTIVVCGMHSEFCVDTTTRKALALGYPVVLIADAHTSAGNQAVAAQRVIAHHNITLTSISSFGPRAVSVLAEDFAI